MPLCNLRYCNKETYDPVRVNENIGDGSWSTLICKDCAKILGLNEGDDLPDIGTIRNKLLRLIKKGGDNNKQIMQSETLPIQPNGSGR